MQAEFRRNPVLCHWITVSGWTMTGDLRQSGQTRRRGIQILGSWIFGGWGEELHGLRPFGPHSDIDLLLHDETFDPIDNSIEKREEFVAIPEKRFSHKRAFEFDGVRVELFLVHPRTLTTNFFSGRHLFQWPADTFGEGANRLGLKICSKAALQLYRSKQRGIISGENC